MPTLSITLNPSELTPVRALMQEYAASLGFSLAYQDFATELATLPGDYVPPLGSLLLGYVDDVAAGVVAVRHQSDGICEMKRLYVRSEHRAARGGEGESLGRLLAIASIAQARTLGYRRMRLDTIASQMSAAIRLYRSLGFVEIAPYYASPVRDTIFMELEL